MRRLGIVWAVIACVLATAMPATAAPGDVDTSFDDNGMLTIGFGAAAEGLVVLDDGTILLGGTSGGDLAFVSLQGSGAPTGGFGTDGVVTLDAGGPDRGMGLAVDDDGSLIVAGWTSGGGDVDTAVGKVDADGTPTASFSGDGTRSYDLGHGKDDRAYDVDVTRTGKIVLGGYVVVRGERRFLLVRLRANGERDTSFGGDGVVKLRVGPRAEIHDVLVLPNDAILVAGLTRVAGRSTDMAVARFRPNGSLDRGFSGDGKIIVGDDSAETAEAIVLLPDGRLGVAGVYSSHDMVVRWFTGSGIPSETMGVNGRTRIAYGTSPVRPYDLLTGANGRIYVVGKAADPTDVFVARLDRDGDPDDAFGDDGRAVADFFGAESGAAAGLTPAGRLLVAGQTDGFDPDPGRAVSGSMLLVRFLP
jgi:uncharacterized delta-60 repeat protein